MVCLGNICRSPLAEGILRSKVNKELAFVDSAGTAAYHLGNIPDERSIAVAKQYGIDISNQQARKFTEKDFLNFDVIYAMDKSNYQNIISLATSDEDIEKVKMILNESQPDKNYSVPDPYYGGETGFEDVYKMLNQACDSVIYNLL
uniref:protein-tyrosine-phosphatase n=1 Tax=uncultured Polaribacter sp. TaxID=174711 RepID=F4MLF8_9FLAO|nr:low molecular weight phosphotyrosine protein phosphatase [uncultured Polaribacter sp.]